MRIFFITTKINFTTAGGSVPDLDQKARILGELGNEVTVITAFSNANSGHENVPYRVIEEQIPARDLLGIQRGILKILRRYENDADIFYIDGQVFLYGAGWYRLTGGRTPVVAFFNRELVCWPENISIFTERLSLLARCKKRLRAWLERRIGMPIASKIDLLTFTSPMLEKAYTDFGLRKDPRAFFQADLIDCRRIMLEQGLDEQSYRRRNKRQGPMTLIFSGRMVAGKGFDIFLDAFAEVCGRGDYRLILSGGGQDSEVIKAYAQKLGVADRVTFPGWVSKDELLKMFHQADIFVLPKWRKELTSVILLEVMALGLPSIVPAGSGQAWVGGPASLTFENSDSHLLAAAILRLANDYDLRAALSAACFERLKELDPRVIAGQLEKLLKETVASRAS